MTSVDPAHATQNAEMKVVETPAAATSETVQDPAKATPESQTNPETKQADEPKAEKVVPEKYELKLADGSFLKPADIERISATAKEKGLSNEEAQALLDGEHAQSQAFFDARKAEYQKQVEGWKEAVASDPEFGGDNFAKSAEQAKRSIEKYGTPELQNLMDSSGFGNHPEVFKFFAKLGKESADDTFVKPGALVSKNEMSREDKLYPTMAKK